MNKIGKFISTILVIIGFVGFLSGSYFYSVNNEIPLGDIKGFVVDKNKNIYVGCGFYERIKVYNKNGEFIKNWPIEAYGGTFYMDKNENNEILITTARGDEQVLFDVNGVILSKKEINGLNYGNYETDWRTFTSDDGVEYEIKGSLFQKIVQLNPEKIIISQNIFLQLIKGPFNVWLLAVFGGLIGYLAKDKNAKNISTSNNSENYKFWKTEQKK